MLNPTTAFGETATVVTFSALYENAARVILSDGLPKERTKATLPTITVWCANASSGRKVPVYLWLNFKEHSKKDLNRYASVQLLGQQIVRAIQENYPHLTLSPKEHITSAEVFNETMMLRMFSDLIPRHEHAPRQALKCQRGQTEMSIEIDENLLLEVFSLGHPSHDKSLNQSDYASVVTGQLFFNSTPCVLVLSSSRCDLKRFFSPLQLKLLVQSAMANLFKKPEVVDLMVSSVIMDA